MREELQALLRALPSVEELAQSAQMASVMGSHPRTLAVEAIRTAVAEVRRAILDAGIRAPGGSDSTEHAEATLAALRSLVTPDALATRACNHLESVTRPNLRRVLNATGVVVHTNLGRSILAPQAIERAMEAAAGYSTLEYRLSTGTRGSRHEHVEGLLTELTGAEAAMVVNNNAAAVLLMLAALAHGHEVIVSRGQLVEIGGSFRIPDIMRVSGARLVEVGTTNKTRLSDYEAAISPDTALLLRVHSSNFKIVGFTEEVGVTDLVSLGAARGIPVADDLGSGALASLDVFDQEPSVQESVSAGADVVTFSGDKLLGGPQAGIVVGRAPWIEAMKRHPLARAVRVDKMTLAALEGTLRLYRDPERAVHDIPTLRYLSRGPAETQGLAEELVERLGNRLGEKVAAADAGRAEGVLETVAKVTLSVEVTGAKAGGGALPLLEVPSHAVVLRCSGERAAQTAGPEWSVVDVERRLRLAPPPLTPVVARVGRDALFLDVAALGQDELDLVAETVSWAVRAHGEDDANARPEGRS